MLEWITTNLTDVVMVLVSVVAVYLVVLICCRITGLRSLAKMSATDFVWTVATGSLLATAISAPSPTVLLAAAAFVAIFALQWIVAWGRRRFEWFEQTVDNAPLLLMRDGEILEENLNRANVSHGELRGKLREANVLNYAQVRAAVMETTGDVSILHSDDPDERFDDALLEGVQS